MNSASSLTALAFHLDLWPDDEVSITVSVPINRIMRGSFGENQAPLSHLGSQVCRMRTFLSERDTPLSVSSPLRRSGREGSCDAWCAVGAP